MDNFTVDIPFSFSHFKRHFSDGLHFPAKTL